MTRYARMTIMSLALALSGCGYSITIRETGTGTHIIRYQRGPMDSDTHTQLTMGQRASTLCPHGYRKLREWTRSESWYPTFYWEFKCASKQLS